MAVRMAYIYCRERLQSSQQRENAHRVKSGVKKPGADSQSLLSLESLRLCLIPPGHVAAPV